MCTSLSHKYYIVYLNKLTTCLDKVRKASSHIYALQSFTAKCEFNSLDAVVNN